MLKGYLQKLDAALRMAEIRLHRGRNDLAQASLDVAENYLKLLAGSFSDDLHINDRQNKVFVIYLSQAKLKYKRLLDRCALVERADSPEKLLEDAFNFLESQRQLGVDRYSLFPAQDTEKSREKTADSSQHSGLRHYSFLAPKGEESSADPASPDPSEQFSFFG